MDYSLGQERATSYTWSALNATSNGVGMTGGTDMLGFISIDDACTLVPAGVWDANGYLRDPQAWQGWYISQPWCFFGPSFWKNSGRSEPTVYTKNTMENAYEGFGFVDSYVSNTYAPTQVGGVVDAGVGSTTQATD